MLFGHGDDITTYSKPIVGNFSSNVWFDGYTYKVQEVLTAAIGKVNNYPEPDARSLREDIAARHGLSYSNIVVTNGAIEAIYLIAQSWSGSRSTIAVPTFSEYEDACTMHRHQPLFIHEDELTADTISQADLVWICNPNNPTGKVRNRNQLLAIIQKHPNVLFVIDQSYGNFYAQELLLPADVLALKNLIVICSLTKCYSIPGLRVGYAMAAAENIEKMLQSKIPWSVNTLAVEVGKYFCNNAESYKLPLGRWIQLKETLCRQLSSITYVEVMPSATPYFLMKLHKGTSSDLKKYLAEEHGLLIRDASNFRGLDNSYVRIAPQDEATNQKLVKALTQWSPTK